MLRDLIELSRPKHWVKNVFVVPARAVRDSPAAPSSTSRSSLCGLLCFCLASSAVYALQRRAGRRARPHARRQAQPADRRRAHHQAGRVRVVARARRARDRPRVRHRAATRCCCCSACTSSINIVYSSGAKHIALIDVFLLSGAVRAARAARLRAARRASLELAAAAARTRSRCSSRWPSAAPIWSKAWAAITAPRSTATTRASSTRRSASRPA